MRVSITLDPADATDLADARALLDRLETAGDPPGQAGSEAGSAPTVTAGDRKFDRALELLYDDGTVRDGSLRFLQQALAYGPGADYSIREIAADLGVEPAQARAYRRNLGRALNSIEQEVPSLPAFFAHSREGTAWRYELVDGVHEAARRRGLI